MTINLQQANESHIAAITQLFYETIQAINRKDYGQDEVDDWSSWHTDTDRWVEKLAEQYFVVALLGDEVVGFASIAVDGYIDFMFVHKDYQRHGIAIKLLKHLEKKAIEQGNKLIYSDVSITARGFFEHNGFVVERQQLKRSKRKELVNFRMTKVI